MKMITRAMEFSPVSINRAEMAINGCLFSYLETKEPKRIRNPFDAVECYVKGEMPWLG